MLSSDARATPNMAFQRTCRPSLSSGRLPRSLGSPLNARPLAVQVEQLEGIRELRATSTPPDGRAKEEA